MNRTITPGELTVLVQAGAATILDVRRRSDFDADRTILPGAEWRDPERLAEWSESVPTDRPVVIYCVRGGSVSNSVLDHLIGRGVPARYIEGGIEGWKAAGGLVAER